MDEKPAYTPDKYQRLALSTWNGAPDWLENYTHAVMGLVDEAAGELLGPIKKARYGKRGYKIDTNDAAEELADVFYYLSMAAHLLGVTLDDLHNILDEKLADGHGWNNGRAPADDFLPAEAEIVALRQVANQSFPFGTLRGKGEAE